MVVEVPGDEPVFIVVFDSVLFSVLAGAGGSLTTVVLLSVLFSAGGLVTVVSFCSHAANKATVAKRQTHLIIILSG